MGWMGREIGVSWRDSGAEQFTAGRSKFDVGIDWTTAARLALPPSRYFGIATPTRCRLCASYHGTQWTMEKRRLSDSKHSKELVGGFLTPCNVARACLWIVQNSPGAGGQPDGKCQPFTDYRSLTAYEIRDDFYISALNHTPNQTRKYNYSHSIEAKLSISKNVRNFNQLVVAQVRGRVYLVIKFTLTYHE
ncbi:hypothetical protein V1477_000283 [Vespula maculifrons]|uniref:Uncharacterized protein n=1 Tax=Vespula maculifrons TaxID=7453 RepID=A0ABD2D144_VESMC